MDETQLGLRLRREFSEMRANILFVFVIIRLGLLQIMLAGGRSARWDLGANNLDYPVTSCALHFSAVVSKNEVCWQAISITQSGKPSDKLELAFRLYDIDRNGSIDQQEMADIIHVSYTYNCRYSSISNYKLRVRECKR